VPIRTPSPETRLARFRCRIVCRPSRYEPGPDPPGPRTGSRTSRRRTAARVLRVPRCPRRVRPDIPGRKLARASELPPLLTVGPAAALFRPVCQTATRSLVRRIRGPRMTGDWRNRAPAWDNSLIDGPCGRLLGQYPNYLRPQPALRISSLPAAGVHHPGLPGRSCRPDLGRFLRFCRAVWPVPLGSAGGLGSAALAALPAGCLAGASPSVVVGR